MKVKKTVLGLGLALGQTTALWAAPIPLAALVTEDELGYQCVPGILFEEHDGEISIAYAANGEVRVPRTCLPPPCERALTRQELSDLTGTEMIWARFEEEWNDYYARYADYCRKEVTPFPEDEVDIDVAPWEGDDLMLAGGMSRGDFWAPILGPNAPDEIETTGMMRRAAPSRQIPTDTFQPNIVLRPERITRIYDTTPFVGASGKLVVEYEEAPRISTFSSATLADGDTSGTSGALLPAVPVPASLGFLAAALGALFGLRRRRA